MWLARDVVLMNLGSGEIIFEPHNMSWVDAVSKNWKNWEKVKIKLETENAHS